MKLSICSPCSESFWQIGAITKPNKLEYGHRHGIPVEFPDYPKLDDHGWCRIDIMQEALKKTEWLLFMGADTMFVNMRIEIAKYVDLDGPSHLWAAIDGNGLQSDVMLLRNCPEMHKVLNAVRGALETDFNRGGLAGTEQGALVRVLSGLPRYINALPVSELQAVIPVGELPKSFNRYVEDFEVSDFVFHACNRPMEDRLRYLTAFAKQVIR